VQAPPPASRPVASAPATRIGPHHSIRRSPSWHSR
jgi:hypothetical protein